MAWFCIPIIAILGGAHMLVWPDVTIRLDNDYLENVSPVQARRTVRISGAVLFLFGVAGLIAVLQHQGGPVDAACF